MIIGKKIIGLDMPMKTMMIITSTTIKIIIKIVNIMTSRRILRQAGLLISYYYY